MHWVSWFPVGEGENQDLREWGTWAGWWGAEAPLGSDDAVGGKSGERWMERMARVGRWFPAPPGDLTSRLETLKFSSVFALTFPKPKELFFWDQQRVES